MYKDKETVSCKAAHQAVGRWGTNGILGKEIHPSFGTQGRYHQKSEIGVSVVDTSELVDIRGGGQGMPPSGLNCCLISSSFREIWIKSYSDGLLMVIAHPYTNPEFVCCDVLTWLFHLLYHSGEVFIQL